MTKTKTPCKCFFGGCKRPVAFSVQRLWLAKGQPLPRLYACAAHKPGSLGAPETAAKFYDITPVYPSFDRQGRDVLMTVPDDAS